MGMKLPEIVSCKENVVVPIYEYVCHDCGHKFEKIVSWSDDTPVCTSCSSANVTRQLSSPAIHFKGSGWYITDSKKGQKGKNGANGVSGKNGEEDKSEKKEKATTSSNGDDSKTPSSSDSKSESSPKKEKDKASS